MQSSITSRLTFAFIGLAIGPLIILGAFLSWQTFSVQERQAFALQEEVAERVTAEVDAFVGRLENELSLLVRVRGLIDLDRHEQRNTLKELLSYENYFEELALLSAEGHELLRLQHLDVMIDGAVDRSGTEAFRQPIRTGKTYFGPVRFDPVTAEPLMVIAVPIPDLRTGKAKGVLVADTRLKKIWRLLSGIRLRDGEDVYIVDALGRVVAHPNPSVVLKGTWYRLGELSKAVTTGLSGSEAVMAVKRIHLGRQQFAIVAERTVETAFALAHNTVKTTALAVLVSLMIAAALAIVAIRNIISPVRRLADVAQRIEDGDLSSRADDTDQDEVGQLGKAFNSMTARLRHSLESLATEVLDRKRAEEEVKAFAQRLSIHVEKTPLGVIEWDLDFKIISWNPAAESIFGYTGAEALGRDGGQFLIPKNEEPAVSRIWDDLVSKSGGTLSVNENLTKSGQIRLCEWYNTSLVDPAGKVIGVASLVQDVTERNRHESQLRKYKRIVGASNDLMALLDKGFVYQAVNDSYLQMHDRKREEIVGATVADLFGITFYEKRIRRNLERCFAGNEVNFQEWFDFNSAGRRYMDFTYYPYREKDGAVTGIVVNVRDITQTKKLEIQLQQAQKTEAIGTLAGGIAHDFNNILSAVIGYTELALYEVEENDSLSMKLGEVLTAGKRARDLVKQILTFSRQGDQEQKPVQLGFIVKEALKLLRATIPTTIEIRQDILSQALILGDPTQIHQVLMNLCTNASHALEDTGSLLAVELSELVLDHDFAQKMPGTKPGPHLKLTVTDNGQGMTPDIMERIFDPFFTTKETGKGTGMGLSVVHGIVKRHNGGITVYSEPGRGTTFSAFFPLLEQERPKDSESEEQLPVGSETILFVDDEKPLASMAKLSLESLGYRVETSENGQEALALFKRRPERFDLVITDMAMPGMTGEELARNLMGLAPDLPVVLCTGFSATIDEQRAMAAGIRAFAVKPIMKREMAETIRAILDGTTTCH